MRLTRKTIIISSIALLLVGGGVFALWRASRDDGAESTQSEQNQSENQNQSETTETLPETKPGTNSGADAPSPSNSPAQGTANVTIAYASGDNDPVVVTATVSGAASGTCTFVFTKNGVSNVQKSVPLNRVTNYYACQVSVAKSDFPARGEWSVKVTFSGENKQGESGAQPVNIP